MIYDSMPFPLFIVTEFDSKKEKSYVVQYKNLQAIELHNLINPHHGNSNPTHKKIKDSSIYDLIEQKFHDLFDKEVERCLNQDSNICCFEFPFIDDKDIIFDNGKFNSISYEFHENTPTFYKGNTNKIKFYKVVATHCTWKGQDAIMVI